MVVLDKTLDGDVLTTTTFDEMAGKVIVRREQDTQAYVDDIKRVKQVSDGKGGNFYHAGRIPAVVVEKFCKEKGMTFAEFMRTGFKTLLNDPDYKNLRIWEGRV